MNLTPEQRDTGKQNFNTAVGTTRRDFLKETLAAGAVAGGSLGAMYFGYGAKMESPLRVGIIGTGDEGSVLIGSLNPDYIDVVAVCDIRPYNRHRAFHGDSANLAARPGLMKVYGWANEEAARKQVKVYEDDYQDLLDDKDVEAVIIALPLWLHDTAAIRAMRAGKHVLTEKLMAQTVARCKEMSRASEELKDADGNPMILATGHQRHYSILYANAVDQIRRGLIGDLHHIRAQWHRGNLPGSDSWSPPMPTKMVTYEEWQGLVRKARGEGADQEADVRRTYKLAEQLHTMEKQLAEFTKAGSATKPDAIDKLRGQIAEKTAQIADHAVDAVKYGYKEKTLPSGYICSPLEELIRWRLWDRTGAGLMAELGSHQLDASSIFISSQRNDGEKVHPLAVQGIGVRSIFPQDRDVDDHVHVQFEFPGKGYYKDFKSRELADPEKKIVVSYSSINGNDFGGYGEVVLGTAGTLVLDREQEAMLFKGGNANTRIDVVDGKGGPALATYETGGGPPPAAALAQAATPGMVSRGYREEIEHWAWCIRNPAPENQPKCGPKVAMADAVIALTSNLALKDNKRYEFKEEWFDIHSDETPEGDNPRKMSEIG